MAADVPTENAPLNTLDEFMNQNGDGDAMPSRKQLLELLKNANVSDELKESIKNMMGGSAQLFGTETSGSMLGVLFIFVIFTILFFFGYKLYKSIKEKEVKREEKKKAKQMKKKK